MTSPTDAEITEGVAEVYNTVMLSTLEALRQRIPELKHPDLCPERFVDWLAATVGLSADVPLAARLETADFRRLIPRLISIWRDKVGPDAYREIIRATTAARSIVADWPALAPVDGDAMVLYEVRSHAYEEGPGGSLSDVTPAAGPQLIEIWAEDTGGLDRGAVVDAARLVRAVEDGVHIVFVDLAEDWTQPTRWVFTGTTSVQADGSLKLAGAGAEARIDGSSWLDGIHDVRTVLRDTGGASGTFRMVIDDDFEIAITEGIAAGNVVLTRLSTVTVLDTATLAVAYDTLLIVRFARQVQESGDLYLRVWVDEVELSATAVAPTPRDDLVFSASSADDEFDVEHLIVMPFNSEVRTLPDGASGDHSP